MKRKANHSATMYSMLYLNKNNKMWRIENERFVLIWFNNLK